MKSLIIIIFSKSFEILTDEDGIELSDNFSMINPSISLRNSVSKLSSKYHNIRDNQIRNKGMAKLSEAIKQIHGLYRLKLNLEGNFIQDDGLLSFARSIQEHRNLIFLDLNLRGNDFSKFVMHFLVDSIGKTENLLFSTIDLSRNISDNRFSYLERTIKESIESKRKYAFVHLNELNDCNFNKIKQQFLSTTIVEEGPSFIFKYYQTILNKITINLKKYYSF